MCFEAHKKTIALIRPTDPCNVIDEITHYKSVRKH